MSTQSSPDDLTRQARDLIEQINRATAHPVDLDVPQIRATVQALLGLVERLPQTLDQLDSVLGTQALAGNIRMDSGGHHDVPVQEARAALTSAKLRVELVAEPLQHAWSTLFGMAGK